MAEVVEAHAAASPWFLLRPSKKALRAAEQERPDVAVKRRRWRGWQRFMDPERFVFLDETATTTDMARRYGRSPLGERLVAAVPQPTGRPPPSSPACARAALWRRWCSTGRPVGCGDPTAPHRTGAAFRAYIEQFLGPALAPGDVVVLDNLAARKVDGVR
jgi:hypothetical protein